MMLPANLQLSKTDAKSNAMTTSRQRNKDTDDFSSSEDEDEDTSECDDDFEVLEVPELSKPAETRHKTFLEFHGKKMHVRCEVLHDTKLTHSTEWINSVSSDEKLDTLEMEFCAVYTLAESDKWSDVLRVFSKTVLQVKLVGIILINYHDNLTLADDFFGDGNVQDMFVCVISRSHQHWIKSLMDESSSGIRVRVVNREDLPEKPGSGSSVDVHVVDKMMDAYFVRAEQYGLDIGLYCHIFSYFDEISKKAKYYKSKKEGLKVVKCRLNKDAFQLSHLNLYCVLVYKMNREGVFWNKTYPKLVKSCTKRFFKVLIEVLRNKPEEIVPVVEAQLQFGNPMVYNGESESPFLHLLGCACLGVAAKLRSFEFQAVGLEIMWTTLHIKFMMKSGNSVDELKSRWTDLLTKQPKLDHMKLLGDESLLIKCALKLGKMLLPIDLQFNGCHAGQLIVSAYDVHSLGTLKIVLEQFDCLLRSDGDFLTDFLVTCQELQLERRKPDSDGKEYSISVPCEGHSFIVTVVKQLIASGATNDRFIQPLQRWLAEILKDNVIENASATVNMILDVDRHVGRNDKVKKVMSDTFKGIVWNKIQDMSLPCFTVYLQSVKDDKFPQWLVRTYLSSFYKKPFNECSMLSKKSFSDFLKAYYSRWSQKIPAVDQACFVDFIFEANATYQDKKLEFIKDLLALDNLPIVAGSCPDVKQVHDTFTARLIVLIEAYKLQVDVCTIFNEAMKKKTEHFTKVQELVYGVFVEEVCKGIPQHSKYLMENLTPYMSCVSTAAGMLYGYYKENPHMWSSPPPTPYNWYWKMITKLCDTLKPSDQSLEWCVNSRGLIAVAALVHGVCPQGENQHEQEEIPPLQYQYFQWVAGLQHVLKHWKQCVEEGRCTTKELKHYHQLSIDWDEDIQKQLCIQSLLLCREFVNKKRSEFQKTSELACNLLMIDGRYSLIGILASQHVLMPASLQSSLKQVFANIQFLHEFSAKKEQWPQIREDVHLSVLIKLVNDFKKFLVPFIPFQKFVVHFTLHPNHFFREFYAKANAGEIVTVTDVRQGDDHEVGINNDGPDCPKDIQNPLPNEPMDEKNFIYMEIFCEMLSATMLSLKNLLTGNIPYEDLIDLNILESVDQEEFKAQYQIVKEFEFESVPESDVMDMGGIEDILYFEQFKDFLELLHDVLKLYGLTDCLSDPSIEEVLKVLSTLNSHTQMMKLTPVQAVENITNIERCLKLPKGSTGRQCVRLFSVVKESENFSKFLKDRNFTGLPGDRLFRQNVQLLTVNLQNEEFQEDILNNLLIAYEFISPFLTPEIHLEDFLQQVYQVCKIDQGSATDDFCQLTNVNRNIDLLYLWFTRTEGNPLEDLECISKHGHFNFVLHCSQQPDEYSPYAIGHIREQKNEVLLMFPAKKTFVDSQPMPDVVWKKEQIDDFIRQLGLLEKDKETEVQRFLDLYEIAKKMLNHHWQLRNLGYQEKMDLLNCNCSLDEAVDKEQNLWGILQKCQKKLSKLDEGCPNLLLLNTPKVLRIHSVLREVSNTEEMMDRLTKEIGIDRDLLGNVKNLIDDAFKQIQDHCSDEEVFRTTLRSLIRMCLPFPESVSLASTGGSCTLHLAIDCSPRVMFGIIFDIHGQHPKAYQILRCRTSTTSEEIEHFLKRVKAFPSLPFTLLAVNLLPARLQELLVQLHNQVVQMSGLGQLHYIATGSSILQDLPKITVIDHTRNRIDLDKCENLFAQVFTIHSVTLVHGEEGDGKSHFIRKRMREAKKSVVITINESFSPLVAITKLNGLSLMCNNVIHFNITWLPPLNLKTDCSDPLHQVYMHEKDTISYHSNILNEVEWFFFDLFYLRYLEDYESGLSFTLPSDLKWSFYIEIPVCLSNEMDCFKEFCERYPLLKIIGTIKHIRSDMPFDVDDDVQLVCNYLRAYKLRYDPVVGIDRVLPETVVHKKKEKLAKKEGHHQRISFASGTLEKDECHELLQVYMKEHAKHTKMQQKLFIGHMKRRCQFMERFPAFNYNTGHTPKLGSTLMKTMLDEVNEFCRIGERKDWAKSTQNQLIYERSAEGDGVCHLFTVNENAMKEELEQYSTNFKMTPPRAQEIHTRECLDRYLAAALNIPLDPKTQRIKALDNNAYVLTLDFFLKMLQIHERMESGIPVIIEGETGVGKTALLEMLSILWNTSLLEEHRKFLDRFGDAIQRIYDDSDDGISEELVKSLVNVMEGTKMKKEILFEDTLLICQSSLASRLEGEIDLRSAIATYLKRNVLQYTIALLDFESSWKEMQSRFTNKCLGDLSFTQFWQACILDCDSPDSESLSIFVFCLLRAKPAQTFYKLSMHSALTPADIGKFFKPVIELANRLMEAWKLVAWRENQQYVPKVTVFLDEVNTSSCPGLLKEIIVDRTLHGTPISENVFIVAACNPHQGNSVIFRRDRKYISKVWTLGMYNVHPLHPTMHYLKWDYGALNQEQEKLYVLEKMNMILREVEGYSLNRLISLSSLSELITASQKIMRELAEEHMKNVLGCSQSDAKKLSHSCVSQRDIQRVFIFLKWLIKCYQSKSFEGRFEENVELTQKFKTAVLVSLALVYYMRLDEHCNFGSQPSSYRSKYVARLKEETGESLKIDVALRDELIFYCEKLHIPSGVAKTNALLENMFCIIACCCTRTPLIITGPPGSSKTLSFSLTLDRIKGRQSTLDPFKDFELFPSLDPLFYQGSKLTTCTEVETVFQRAIKRQRRFNEAGLPINCVVFMDEAGLPKESLEVLHKFLDHQEVSFVAITNHVLDAAKTNRAVSLFRSNYVQEDLYTLMKECLPDVPETAEKLCDTYYQLMTEDDNFQEFFGLRDFIHLGHYMRRKSQLEEGEIPQCLMQAIERNFNGYEYYDDVCQKFLSAIGSSIEEVDRRSIINVLKSSLSDKPTKDHLTDEANKVRYKLLIDSSEDESVRRLLFSFKIVDPSTTKTYMCSDFPEDSEVQKINTIAAIRHSIRKGSTIVMTQTASIHGSFYDVFNQYFKIIEETVEGKTKLKFYANIAIGSDLKQCQVHEEFQCIVVIKLSDLSTTPGPFLNRFEKYSLSHKDFLEARLTDFPPNLKSILSAVRDKVEDFVNHFEHSSFYGVIPGETVNSLVLSILPQCDFKFDHSMKDSEMPCGWKHDILQYIIQVLQTEAGMRFTMVASSKEMVWKINPSDEKDEAFFSDTSHKTISSAMKYLLSSNPDHEQITKESQFVVSVISQWLVVYLCSKLLNLMTAEGFILSQVKMLPWCMDIYLFDQSHFSLKDTITSYFRELQNCCEKSTIKLESVCNKVVCFTHSTPAIHGLPEFTSTDSVDDSVDVKRIIYDDVARVYLSKLSSITSEKALRNHLQKFFTNTKKDIMVMVIGMQETSIQIVNHVRIIVEETETSVTQRKLFIFLLHFPSSLYHKPCYPAIFANGWDHCYLDTVLPRTLDIRQWFRAAYKGGSDKPQLFQEKLLDYFCKDAVKVISSRVVIGSPNGGGFNSRCDTEERLKRFKELLDGPVGDKLATLYIQCWEQPELAFCLKEAAEHTRNNMTSLSISEVVHDHFRTTFYNFLSFMIHSINTDLNIDLIFDHDKDSHICKLFLQLLDLLPVPKIAEIKAYNNTFDSRQPEAFKPSFPFFWKVNSTLDCLVEEAIKEYQEERTLGSKPKQGRSTKTNKFAKSDVLVESIVAKIDNHSTDMLGHVLTVLERQPQLWEEYIKHFLCSKCHIRDFENPTVTSVITMQFGPVLVAKDIKKKLARLHYETLVEPRDLAIFSPSPLSPDPMDIIPSLFGVFSSDSIDDECVKLVDRMKKMQLWHSMFLEYIIHPSFKQLIFTRAIEPAHKSKLHVMTAVFHLMQAQQFDFGSDNDYKFLLAVRQSLLDQLSKENDSIGLSGIMDSILKFSEQSTTKNDAENQKSVAINITQFLETILEYFINAQRPLDMPSLKWFLHDLNTMNGVVARITHSTSKQQKSGDLRNIQVRLLGDMLTGSFEGSSMSQPLDVFNRDVRALVGQELHVSGAILSSYFPPVYREKLKCSISIQYDDDHSINGVMEVQPLADVYYLCLMEHWGRDHNINLGKLEKLENFMRQIKQEIGLVKDTAEQILLHIELQAVLQVALNVFAMELVSHFSKRTTKLPDLDLMQCIISGNAIDCHKRMVMVFLLRHLRSPYALNEFLNSPTFEDMASVLPEPFRPIKPLLVHNTQPLHLFSFMDSKASDKLANAYKSVSILMCEIASDVKSSRIIKRELSHLLRNDDPLANSQGFEVDRKLFLKMSVWLVAYYDFFLKKKTSPVLVKAVKQQGYLSILDFTPEQVSVLECFLMQNFIKRKENTLSKNVPQRDPLYELFTGKDLEHSAEDAGLCNAVANMVAVGFSLPPNHTHLWPFLFDQKALVGTLLPGFECNRPVGLTANRFLYELGPASALGLSLHSMYLMLLQNFGALSIAMLTQGEAQEVIHGGIISREVSVRHFCTENLRLLWEKLRLCVHGDNLLRIPLVTQCLQRLLKVVHTEKMHLDMKFMDSSLVYAYEQFWHLQIYSEGRSHLELKYQEQCPLSREEFFVSLRDIDDHCLHFPSLTTMKHDLVEHVGIDSGGPQVLLMFVNIYQRLSVGSALLPLLVKMYNWLNTHLAHLLTHQQAMEKTVDEIFHLASEHFSDGDLVWTNYEAMKVQFNKFVDLYGGYVWHEDTFIGKIDDSTKIVQLLTEGSKNDWLCATMDTIVALHNSLIDMVKKAENREFHSWLTNIKQDVYGVSRFQQNMAIVWENDNFDQELASLFYSRCSCGQTSAQSMLRKYEWDDLECDVVRQYIIGKPQLSGVNKRPFRFRTDPTENLGERSNGVTSPGHPVDLAALHQELHEYKLKELSSLCQEDKSLLESTFHNLDYTNLSKLVQSLRNAAGWLHERLLEDEESIRNETLRILFTSEQLNETIGTSSLQESILMGFQVTQVHEILEIFVEWIDSCYYSFSELPYTLKHPLSDEQKEWTRNVLQESASHDMSKTLGLVRDLENSLTHIIQTGINYLLQQSLTSILRDYVQICQLLDNDYLRIIHSRVQLQHIVHFIILLRSEKNKLENGPALVAVASSKEWHDKIDLSLPNFDPSAVDFTLSQQQTHRTHSSSLSTVTIWVDHKTHLLPMKPHPYDPVSEVVKSWTVEQVIKWLKDIGLGKYAQRFEEEEIDGARLAYIDKDCLEELGVDSALNRNKIISKLRKIPN